MSLFMPLIIQFIGAFITSLILSNTPENHSPTALNGRLMASHTPLNTRPNHPPTVENAPWIRCQMPEKNDPTAENAFWMPLQAPWKI